MPSVMRRMNVIGRCQGIYRTEKLDISDIGACHHSFILLISAHPGMSQEQIARHLCLNKSTVTRALCNLENAGYVERRTDTTDKRVVLVYPTQRMLSILPTVKKTAREWNEMILSGVSAEDLEVFFRVLESMEMKARDLTGNSEVPGGAV